MITGAHTIVYATDADAARTFFRDVLGLSNVDAGDGWLIFKSPPGELAVHPAAGPSHELYLMCDDVKATATLMVRRVVRTCARRGAGRFVPTLGILRGSGHRVRRVVRRANPESLAVAREISRGVPRISIRQGRTQMC